MDRFLFFVGFSRLYIHANAIAVLDKYSFQRRKQDVLSGQIQKLAGGHSAGKTSISALCGIIKG